ncbi:hypothetical protein XBJ2_1790002 [Xenorhabdus bovienii str. Jollieti]|nr:hypothetical protein XBJ2_1790002 [Xenorhabdus bovienii str. Jollieti]
MNSVENGIHIPGSKKAMQDDVGKGMKVFHSSNHNTYSGEVRQSIEEIKRRHDAGNLSDRQARDEIRKLQMKMKNKIWSGDVPSNPCKRLN